MRVAVERVESGREAEDVSSHAPCGPTLAAGFIRRGLVDEYALVVHLVILGGGTPFFPELERPAGLRLLETRTFSSDAVYLGFAAR